MAGGVLWVGLGPSPTTPGKALGSLDLEDVFLPFLFRLLEPQTLGMSSWEVLGSLVHTTCESWHHSCAGCGDGCWVGLGGCWSGGKAAVRVSRVQGQSCQLAHLPEVMRPTPQKHQDLNPALILEP